jgi:ankyrin repeat protein
VDIFVRTCQFLRKSTQKLTSHGDAVHILAIMAQAPSVPLESYADYTDLMDMLIAAVKQSDEPFVDFVLRMHPMLIYCLDGHGNSLLIHAAGCGNAKMVRNLLDKGLVHYILHANMFGATAITVASVRNDDVSLCLLEVLCGV